MPGPLDHDGRPALPDDGAPLGVALRAAWAPPRTVPAQPPHRAARPSPLHSRLVLVMTPETAEQPPLLPQYLANEHPSWAPITGRRRDDSFGGLNRSAPIAARECQEYGFFGLFLCGSGTGSWPQVLLFSGRALARGLGACSI